MKKIIVLTLALTFPSVSLADEGMWLFNNFPAKDVKAKYGSAPDAKWLEHVRQASVRLARGCSGSFVSADGLVMTNHHCVHGCVEQLSSSKRDYVTSGFLAKRQKDEKKCPAFEVNQLVDISDVTARINKATAGLSDKKYNEARKAEMSRIEKACATSDKLRCDVVTLYNGGRYNLYKYKRYQDTRLVFAPEIDIAFFGGDPDNFNFPRYVLDVAFLRVYEDGKPAKPSHHLDWSKAGAKDEELVYVSGHPGSTRRLKTISELEYMRDVYLPERLFHLAELRGMLTEFSNGGKENARVAKTPLFYVENGFKALKGRRLALIDEGFMGEKRRAERELRQKIDRNPKWKKSYGSAWAEIEKTQTRLESFRSQINFKEFHRGFGSRMMRIARTLVRLTAEKQKPNESRLREYTDGKLPAVEARLMSPAPIHKALEIATMTFWLTKLREELGADDPFVRLVLDRESPKSLATRLVRASRLNNVVTRKRLLEGGPSAVEKSKDPMIQLARKIDHESRRVRKIYEDEIDSIIKRNSERIAKARFEVYGTSTYPDATFTLRLSYGQVKGFPHMGETVRPFTNIGGAFARATKHAPYVLPRSWQRKHGLLDLKIPMNFVSTNDIIGGNSGSPIINKAGEVVGVVFDGNIYSLGGDYGFDESVNRTISVHSSAILEALDKVYGAKRVLGELRP